MATRLKTVVGELDANRNTRIWDALGKTDPGATKKITGKRFGGTAVKPMWINKRLTEHFGPCGIGWGMGKPDFTTIHGQDGQVLVYCTTEVWYVDPGTQDRATSVGVGGDFVIKKESSGLFFDDEAYKKAYTDALGNAWKFIGVAADIHMGLFDDNKYVAEVNAEFNPPREKVVGIHKIKERLSKLLTEGNAATDLEAFNALVKAHKDDLKTIRDANHEWWTGDGADFEGFDAWKERRKVELAPVATSLEYQLLVSTLNECTSGNEYQAWLSKNGDVIDSLDGAESRAFEQIHDERAAALKLVDVASV